MIHITYMGYDNLYRSESKRKSNFNFLYSSNGSCVSTAQYSNIEIRPSEPLSRSVVDKSWNLAQLKSHVDIAQRENQELKLRLEAGDLAFDRYREDVRGQICDLNRRLEETSLHRSRDNWSNSCAHGNEWDTSESGQDTHVGVESDLRTGANDVENESEVTLADGNEGNNQQSSQSDTNMNIVSEQNSTPVDVEQTSSPVRRRNHLTICNHVFCKEFLY